MALAIEHAITQLDDSMTDGVREMVLSDSRWTLKQGIFSSPHLAGSGQNEYEIAIHSEIKLEVEFIHALIRIAEASLFLTPFQPPLCVDEKSQVRHSIAPTYLIGGSRRVDAAVPRVRTPWSLLTVRGS